jgi:hypothetical protein
MCCFAQTIDFFTGFAMTYAFVPRFQPDRKYTCIYEDKEIHVGKTPAPSEKSIGGEEHPPMLFFRSN